MSSWPIKKLFRGFIAFGGAYLLGAAILDAVGNAVALINWPFTIGGTVAVLCVWLALQAVLRRYPARLGAYSIKRLNYLPACGLLGLLVLLWTPRLLTLLHRPETPSAPAVSEGIKSKEDVLVLVSEFPGPNPESYGVTQIIFEQLTNAVKDYSDVRIKQLRAPIDNGEDAAAKGKEEGADIVLWGSYLANAGHARVTIHFEVLDIGFDVPLSHDNKTIVARTAKLESFTIQEELSKQMTYLVLLTVGVARLGALDFGGAITSFSQAIAASKAPTEIIEPHHIYEYRAMTYLLNIQIDEAISDFSQALRFKRDPQLLELRAMAYMFKAQFDEAFKDANTAIQLEASDQAYSLRGFIYLFVKKDSRRALQDFEKALALDPNSDSALSSRALFLLEQKNWNQAILDYEKIISLDISNRKRSNAFGGLALAFEGKGDLQKALLNFSLAIQEDPQRAEAYYNRAWFYSKQGAPDDAIKDADKAILLAPAKSRNYTVRGNALLDKGEADKAISDYSKAISLEPHGPTTYGDYYNRGRAHFVKRDFEKAIEDYDHAIKLKPDFSDAYGNRCNVYLSKRVFDRAIADCSRSIALNPLNSHAYNNRGAALASQGLFSKAMSDFQQALKLDPQNSLAHLNTGLAYKDQGQIDKAIPEFRKVIQMGRNTEAVTAAKLELCGLAREQC